MLADVAAGATLHPTRGYLGVPLARVARAAAAATPPGSRPAARRRPARSATSPPGLELLEQIARGELPRPDVIYVALGSCGTAAGLLVGLGGAPTLPRLEARVVGVRVVDRVVANERVTLRLAAAHGGAAGGTRRTLV